MEEPYRLRVYFYKDDHQDQVFTLGSGTKIIESSNVSEVPPGSLLTNVGIHRKNLGPDDIRHLTHDQVMEHYKKIPTGQFSCIDIICYPNDSQIINPTAEVS